MSPIRELEAAVRPHLPSLISSFPVIWITLCLPPPPFPPSQPWLNWGWPASRGRVEAAWRGRRLKRRTVGGKRCLQEEGRHADDGSDRAFSVWEVWLRAAAGLGGPHRLPARKAMPGKMPPRTHAPLPVNHHNHLAQPTRGLTLLSPATTSATPPHSSTSGCPLPHLITGAPSPHFITAAPSLTSSRVPPPSHLTLAGHTPHTAFTPTALYTHTPPLPLPHCLSGHHAVHQGCRSSAPPPCPPPLGRHAVQEGCCSSVPPPPPQVTMLSNKAVAAVFPPPPST